MSSCIVPDDELFTLRTRILLASRGSLVCLAGFYDQTSPVVSALLTNLHSTTTTMTGYVVMPVVRY
mgnify:CR=1 FL=1